MAAFPADVAAEIGYVIQLVINGGTVVGVEEPWMAARFADLGSDGLIVEFNAEPRRGGQRQIAILHDKGRGQIAFAKMYLFLRQKVGHGGVEL